MSKFPHLTSNGNESDFPDIDNVKVYQYDNTYDYEKFDHAQMRLILCKVPWDMGEAHVGARTISGIGNVVYFENQKARDEWFDNLDDDECFRFQTKYRALHRDNQIVLPIPYDVAARFNYLAVYYEPIPNPDNPVMYEVPGGITGWFWFVREVEFLAPNSTRLHLMNDAWQTFIYDIEIPYMMLERGHAPMKDTSVKEYLRDPIAHCAGLLADDVNYGDTPRIAVSSHEHVINGGALSDMYAVIVANSTPTGTWGTKAGGTWKVPANQSFVQGVPASFAFAVKATDLSTFLSSMKSQVPQFAQTVQAVFFANEDLISISGTFTFCSHTCYTIASSYTSVFVHDIDKADFKYSSKYADIAKLYTYPYSVIVLTDQDGVQTEIRVEDTHGSIKLDYCASLAFPFLKVRGEITNVGKNPRKGIVFHNVSTRNMPIGGNWYDLLFEWQIPTFSILQEASTHNDYATHFDRVQEAYAADNAKTSADASADTAKANADANADTMLTNEQATQAGLVSNKNDAKALANLKIDTITDGGTISQIGGSGGYIADTYDAALDKLSDDTDADQILMIQMAGFAEDTIVASAVVNAGGSIAGGIASGAAQGAALGVPGAVAGGIAGGTAQAITASSSAAIAITNNSNVVSANISHSDAKFRSARDNAMALANAQIAYNGAIKDADNDYLDDTVDRFSGVGGINNANAGRDNATQKANATRTQNTEKANNVRARDTVSHSIANQIAQAALEPAQVFGSSTNGDGAITKPLALFSTVVTQDDYAIARAGDEFLRYGYMYNRQYEFDGNWCKMPRFTYWKLSDFWVRGLQVPDMYVDKIRFFLFGGVTVWKNPEDIGHFNIYENV